MRETDYPIYEKYARIFAELANVPPGAVEDCVEIITGIDRPDKLLEKIEQGKMTAPAMFAAIRKRRGMVNRDFSPAPLSIKRYGAGQLNDRSQLACIHSMAQDMELDIGQARRFALLSIGETPLREEALMTLLKEAASGTRDKAEVMDTLIRQTSLIPTVLTAEMEEKTPATLTHWGRSGCGAGSRFVAEKFCLLLDINDANKKAFADMFESLYSFRTRYPYVKPRNETGSKPAPRATWQERHTYQEPDSPTSSPSPAQR